jgi:hypothetical protein
VENGIRSRGADLRIPIGLRKLLRVTGPGSRNCVNNLWIEPLDGQWGREVKME